MLLGARGAAATWAHGASYNPLIEEMKQNAGALRRQKTKRRDGSWVPYFAQKEQEAILREDAFMKVEIKIPPVGESVTEARVSNILKATGSIVKLDEEITRT